ncbi:putative helitron helicase-like domain-containing protein [Helianthus annuus]|nr:putative helitron helicase-like domain-containing protein [Helianthus annuus]
MQHPRSKRPRIVSSSTDVASSSDSSFDASSTSRRQTSHRSAMLRSRAAMAAADSVGFPAPALQSPDYIDMGLCTGVCEYCGALFWFQERLTSFPISVRPRYNRCCRGGRIKLQYPSEPPDLLKSLFSDTQFMLNIRAYNAMFCMTSFGAVVDDATNQGGGPYVFKVAGQVSHWLGSLCPSSGDGPRFLQMYVYDSEHEIANRLRFFPTIGSDHTAAKTVAALAQMLDHVNPYVRLFRSARELCSQADIPDFEIRLHNRVRDNRYSTPASHTLGAIVCDNSQLSADFDVVIKSKDNTPHRVSKLHSAYMPLQYPLLFPRAEQGWSPDLKLTGTEPTTADEEVPDDPNLTPIMFYGYQMHDRENVYTHILRASKLLQQYLVDAYICVEHCRLDYYRANQDEFRCEFFQGVQDAVSRGDTDASTIGKRVILPSSFTGGPRYMYKHYQDALAKCRVHGNPQYFITFTCNVRWPEITREISRVGAANAQDRPDIIARVFQTKVLKL